MAKEQIKNKPTISWEIKRVDDHQKSDTFYFVLLGLMVLLLVFSIWQRNFLFGIFIILATGTLLFITSQRPETFSFELTEKEVIVGEEESIYEYDKFSHFDIYEYNENDYEIFFVFKEKLKPVFRARIWKGDREKIEEFLKTKLPQKKTEPSLLDIVSRILGI